MSKDIGSNDDNPRPRPKRKRKRKSTGAAVKKIFVTKVIVNRLITLDNGASTLLTASTKYENTRKPINFEFISRILKVPKRRLYDIVNVCIGMGMLTQLSSDPRCCVWNEGVPGLADEWNKICISYHWGLNKPFPDLTMGYTPIEGKFLTLRNCAYVIFSYLVNLGVEGEIVDLAIIQNVIDIRMLYTVLNVMEVFQCIEPLFGKHRLVICKNIHQFSDSLIYASLVKKRKESQPLPEQHTTSHDDDDENIKSILTSSGIRDLTLRESSTEGMIFNDGELPLSEFWVQNQHQHQWQGKEEEDTIFFLK